jgi:DNA-binding transcriptional ArsR family regulator
MGAGYVPLPRSTFGHPALQNFTRRGLFTWLWLRAVRDPARIEWRGNLVPLGKGQLVVSVRELAEKNDAGHKEVRGHLEKLKNAGLITLSPILGTVKGTGKGTVGTLVTLCLDVFKSDLTAGRGTTEGTVEGRTGAQRGHNGGTLRETIETLETPPIVPPGGEMTDPPARRKRKRREARPEPEGFPEFWAAYPRKAARPAAAEAYRRAAEIADPGAIISGLMDARAEWRRLGTEGQYLPHPSSWLNQRRWDDPHDAEPAGAGGLTRQQVAERGFMDIPGWVPGTYKPRPS